MSTPAVSPSLSERFVQLREATNGLVSPLSAEDCQVQSMPDVSPTKWHLAHTTWFFETFLLESLEEGFTPFHPQFRVLFNSYYHAVGERHPRPLRGLLSRPSLDEVREFRAKLEERLLRILESRELDEPFASFMELGIQHEQQHQELILMDIQHVLGTNPLRSAYLEQAAPEAPDPGPLGWEEQPEGLTEIGYQGRGFSFDNERPRHRVWLGPFALADRLITNREYLEFMCDGGYERPELWLSEGWDWKERESVRAPLYWERERDRWHRAGLCGYQALALDLPVAHISYYEADAYAQWTGFRLATEFEWERVAAAHPLEGSFLEARRWQAGSGEGKGMRQLYGELWQWTSSPYTGYPGYRIAEGALGEYNGKFMSNQIVLRGGSCATPRSHARVSYRNFFAPHTRWLFGGIRLARDL